MAKMYLYSSRIALWMNDKEKNRKIVKIFIVLYNFLYGTVIENFQCALLVESNYRVLLV